MTWTNEQVFHEGDAFYAAVLAEIDGATRCIDLETYIFDQDRLGKRVLERLAAAAARGVRVRLLLDGVGCARWTHEDLQHVRRAGIDARIYHPLPWQTRDLAPWRLLTLRRLVLALGKLNRRNHRKTCVVDERAAFAGGMNVSSRHLASHAGAEAWRDTSARVEGEGISTLTLAFDHAWSHSRSLNAPWRRPRIPLEGPVRLNLTPRHRRASYRGLLRRIASARERIWIANPYFVPDIALLRALRYAAWSGVDVRLIFPHKHDIVGLKWVSTAYYRPLLTSGVRIFEYRPSILHAKTVLIDGSATVGSSNLNHRSLLHDLEADLELSSPGSIRSLQEQFERDLARSQEVEHAAWDKKHWLPGLARGFLQSVALLFRRWL